MAWNVACLRIAESISAGLKHAYGYSGENQWQDNMMGACGELAFCKWLNVFWTGSVNSFKDPDVDPNFQIRWSKRNNLIFRHTDNPDHWYILVNGNDNIFRLVGYIHGTHAKQLEECRAAPGGRPPALFIPEQKLIPFEKYPRQKVVNGR